MSKGREKERARSLRARCKALDSDGEKAVLSQAGVERRARSSSHSCSPMWIASLKDFVMLSVDSASAKACRKGS